MMSEKLPDRPKVDRKGFAAESLSRWMRRMKRTGHHVLIFSVIGVMLSGCANQRGVSWVDSNATQRKSPVNDRESIELHWYANHVLQQQEQKQMQARIAEVKAARLAAEATAHEENVTRHFANTPNRPAHIRAAVLEKKVTVGMTAAEAELAWGKPQRKNITGSTYGRHEQWVYHGSYLYIENGIVSSWQISE
jgi:hypothetical protein